MTTRNWAALAEAVAECDRAPRSIVSGAALDALFRSTYTPTRARSTIGAGDGWHTRNNFDGRAAEQEQHIDDLRTQNRKRGKSA